MEIYLFLLLELNISPRRNHAGVTPLANKEFCRQTFSGNALLNLAILGRYILTLKIFIIFDKLEVGGWGKEVQMTGAIQLINNFHIVFA